MIRRLVSALALAWTLGFLWFAAVLPQPAGPARTDGIVVPTGGAGRIEHGLALLRRGAARQLLVTGVDPQVTVPEFEAEYRAGQPLMTCCVTLGSRAADTRGNASETADWVRRNGVGSLRLVTADSHMRRAALELSRRLPARVTLLQDAVATQPSFGTLFMEYNKLLVTGIYGWVRAAWR